MEFIKRNIKILILLIVVLILSSSISIYATYNYLASNVMYTKDNGTEISVQRALNELYGRNVQCEVLGVRINDENGVEYSYTATEKAKLVVVLFSARGTTGVSSVDFYCKKNGTNVTHTSEHTYGTNWRVQRVYLVDVVSGDVLTLKASSTQPWGDNGYAVVKVKI